MLPLMVYSNPGLIRRKKRALLYIRSRRIIMSSSPLCFRCDVVFITVQHKLYSICSGISIGRLQIPPRSRMMVVSRRILEAPDGLHQTTAYIIFLEITAEMQTFLFHPLERRFRLVQSPTQTSHASTFCSATWIPPTRIPSIESECIPLDVV